MRLSNVLNENLVHLCLRGVFLLMREESSNRRKYVLFKGFIRQYIQLLKCLVFAIENTGMFCSNRQRVISFASVFVELSVNFYLFNQSVNTSIKVRRCDDCVQGKALYCNHRKYMETENRLTYDFSCIISMFSSGPNKAFQITNKKYIDHFTRNHEFKTLNFFDRLQMT